MIKIKMIMVPFSTNQNLTIFTASFTISGSVCDIKISQIKITKHTAKWCEIYGKTLNKISRFKVSHIKYYQINRNIA